MGSAELIAQLLANGYTYASIGRAIGRDRSLVRQIAVGSKPGRNLTASLAQLAQGAAPAPPPRRLSRSGEPARVRGGRSSAGRTARRDVRAEVARRTELPSGARMADGFWGSQGASRADLDGFASGTSGALDLSEGKAWRIAGWSNADFGHGATYQDIEKGAPPPGPDARYITVYIEGLGYRQFTYYPTDDFDLVDAIEELIESYGEAYPR